MSKMKELSQILDDMIEAGNGLIKTADALREYFSSAPEEMQEPAEEKKVVLTKEDVRKLLVEKSNVNDGEFRPEVKALVRKYASESGTLSSVKPEDYEALIAELEVIGHASY